MASTPSERTKHKPERKTARASEKTVKAQSKAPTKDSPKKKSQRKSEPTLRTDQQALKKLKLVAVAYSQVEREWFETDEAYEAEVEVEARAKQILEQLERLGIPAKGYPSDQYFVTNLLVDDPDLVLNLVDTLKGKDVLGTSVPAALELTNIPYTGTGMQGLVIGNNRDLVKQLLVANEIPTPNFQVIRRAGTRIREDLSLPLICKLNQSGGSVGIDNKAVKETYEEAQERAEELLKTYRIPVVVERFIDGPEVQVIVIDDGRKKHVFMAQKNFTWKPDGKHEFTSFESYEHDASNYGYKFEPMDDEALKARIERDAAKAFTVLRYKDYAKFDVRVDKETKVPYITDANPNTAIGPDPLLPLTEVLALHGISFDEFMMSLLSKHAKKIR
jgi:D-alanine-D-alanine ligase